LIYQKERETREREEIERRKRQENLMNKAILKSQMEQKKEKCDEARQIFV
jgi:hypothetical protein